MAEKRNYCDVTIYGMRESDPGRCTADGISVLDDAHAGAGVLCMVGGVDSYILIGIDSLLEGGSFNSGSCRS
jgi:hypothetical protein